MQADGSQGGALSGLQSETSDATTFGIVWTPNFADLQVAVDWFDINIEDEVTQLGAANILLGCYDSIDFANEPLCDLFVRNPPPSQPGDPPAFLLRVEPQDVAKFPKQVIIKGDTVPVIVHGGFRPPRPQAAGR